MQSASWSSLAAVSLADRVNFTDYAITNKLTPFISMQNHYNLLYREEEREMLPTLKVRYAHNSLGLQLIVVRS